MDKASGQKEGKTGSVFTGSWVKLLGHSLTIMHFSLPPQIYYYADSIYATAGVKQNDIQYVTVGTGAVNVFMTIAAVGTLLSLLTIVVNDGRN